MRKIFERISQNSFLQNSFILFSGTMIINVLNYIFHVGIGRMVSPSLYGEIESLISLLTIISVPAATLTLIATKYAADMKAGQDVRGVRTLARYLNRKIFMYGLPLFFLALFLTPLVQKFLNIDSGLPIIFLWVVMFLSFLSAVTLGLLMGWQRFGDVNKVGIASSVIKLASVFLMLVLGFGLSGVVGSFILTGLCTYFISLWLLNKLLKKSQDDTKKDFTLTFSSSLKGYILPAFYGTLAIAILGNADIVFAKHHLEAALSGEYGALSVAAKTIFFVTGVLTTVLFAMAAEESKRTGDAGKTFRLAAGLTAIVSAGSVVFFALFPELVLAIFFGSTYLHASSWLAWFALAAGIYSLANLFLQYLLSLHETRAASIILAIVSLEIPLLYFFGETFYGIIRINILMQSLAALVGFVFIYSRHRRRALTVIPGFSALPR